MALNVYEDADPGAGFSQSGIFTNPLSTSFDGIIGGSIDRRFYVRNNSTDHYYDNINLEPVVTSGDDIVGGTDGYEWKLYAGDQQPLEAQWETTVAGNDIDLGSIGSISGVDTTTYLPFWLRISVPKGAPVKSYSKVVLRFSATETAI